jgi:hypothetical protein
MSMILFRVAHKDNGSGMWYSPEGEEIRLVDQLTNKRLADLPMAPDPRYNKQGKVWRCAAWSLAHLEHWFTLQDMLQLLDWGFEVYAYTAHDYVIERENNQVLFTMESVTKTENVTTEFMTFLLGKVPVLETI